MGSHLTWNFACCVYILASSGSLYKIYIINKVFTECFTTLLLDAIGVKITGGQWSKAWFCPPGGRSYNGVTSNENYQLMSLSKLITALLGNQSWLRDTVAAQRCEIQWEAFKFTSEWIKVAVRSSENHSNSAQNFVS